MGICFWVCTVGWLSQISRQFLCRRCITGAMVILGLVAGPAAGQNRIYVDLCKSLIYGCSEIVSVFDAGTNKLITTIPVNLNGNANRAFAMTPDAKRLYLTGGDVLVIDTSTNQVVAGIGGIPKSNSIVMAPDGRRAYVGSGFGFVSVVDTLTNKVITNIMRPDATIDLGGSYWVYGNLAISPDGKRLYVADLLSVRDNYQGNLAPSISVIDTATNLIVTNITVDNGGGNYTDMFVSPDGSTLYYHPQFSLTTIATLTNNILVHDSHMQTATMTLSPDGKLIYFASSDPAPDALLAIESDPRDGKAFLNNPVLERILTPHITPGASTTSDLYKIAITADGKFAYVLDIGYPGSLIAIDLIQKSVTADLMLGPAGQDTIPYALAIVPPPKPVAVSITPQSVSLSLGRTQQFNATALNDINRAVAWSITPQLGFISSDGVYTPPTSIPAKQIVTLTVTSVADSTKSASATITLTPPGEMIASDGIVNSASGRGGWIAPGEILTLSGSGFGPQTTVTASPDASGILPRALAGVRVLFDGLASPLLYAANSRVSAVVPFALSGKGDTLVQVEYQGERSNPVDVSVAEVAPGIFTLDSSGAGQALLLNQDGSQNSPSNPALPGSTVVFYATGTGGTNAPGIDGQIAADSSATPVSPIQVQIAGTDAEPVSASGVPGSVAGLVQIQVQLPADCPPGDAVWLSMSAAGIGSQAGVTMAVGTAATGSGRVEAVFARH